MRFRRSKAETVFVIVRDFSPLIRRLSEWAVIPSLRYTPLT
jgi:hypothetical protein